MRCVSTAAKSFEQTALNKRNVFFQSFYSYRLGLNFCVGFKGLWVFLIFLAFAVFKGKCLVIHSVFIDAVKILKRIEK